MGYTTEFEGHVTVDPPLNTAEITYLNRFAETRRMHRQHGPYYCGEGDYGQAREPDLVDYDQHPPEQPNLWCQWVPTDDGTAIVWNDDEKFYDPPEWMTYLIDTFLKPGAALQAELTDPIEGRYYAPEFASFTFDHVCNGVIAAQGENPDDQWRLIVTDNVVTVEQEPDRDAIANLVAASRELRQHLGDEPVERLCPAEVNFIAAVDALNQDE